MAPTSCMRNGMRERIMLPPSSTTLPKAYTDSKRFAEPRAIKRSGSLGVAGDSGDDIGVVNSITGAIAETEIARLFDFASAEEIHGTEHSTLQTRSRYVDSGFIRRVSDRHWRISNQQRLCSLGQPLPPGQ